MKWVERRNKDVVVIDLMGELKPESRDVQLRSIIFDLLDRDEKKILLNFDKTSYMDSVGIAELIVSYTTAFTCGAELKLLKLPRQIHDLLHSTQLISVFEYFSDEATAVESFNTPTIS
jgi:anti-sigma B factor antagonist